MSCTRTRPPRASQRPLKIHFRGGVTFCLAGAATAVFLLGPAALAVDPPEVVLRPPREGMASLTAQEQKRVQKAIDRGVAYLKRTQLPTGSWIKGQEVRQGGRYLGFRYPTGFAGLAGLALIESGVPADDLGVQAAARFIRQSGAHLFRTYDLALAVLFLDRLGDARDRPLIRCLALRLVAGQNNWGGWTYDCPVLGTVEEKNLERALRKKTRADLPKQLSAPLPRGPGLVASSDTADNSNTQFALMALWAARRHDLPLEYPLGLCAQRFRSSATPMGWDYHWQPVARRPDGYGSMTCVGLLGLAVGTAAAEEKPGPEAKRLPARPEDRGIMWGLTVLARYLRIPSDVGTGSSDPGLGARGALNLYFFVVRRAGGSVLRSQEDRGHRLVPLGSRVAAARAAARR
jgi:hypothetical protein